MFKVNNKDTRTTPLASFWYLYCYLQTYFTLCSSVSIVNFVQVNADWELICSKLLNNNSKIWRQSIGGVLHPVNVYEKGQVFSRKS